MYDSLSTNFTTNLVDYDLGPFGNNLNSIVVKMYLTMITGRVGNHISPIVATKLVLQILGSYWALVGMTISRVGNNLLTIVATNLIDYDYLSSWEQS